MPVSRRRKKKNGRGLPAPRRSPALTNARAELVAAQSRMLATRAKLDEARSLLSAARAAAALSDGLIELGDVGTDAEFEDALCAWLGPWLLMDDDARLEEYLGPNDAFDGLIHAAADRIVESLDQWDTESGIGERVWRVLATLGAIAPSPIDQHVASVTSELRRGPGGQVLPPLPPGPQVNGDVRWTRDAYGSRFGIIAPFETHGVTRWYLWDVDACGFEVFTVFSGYFADADAAADAWRTGVGDVAAHASAFGPVDDVGLMLELLPAEMGVMRVGGESADQLAEYHRGIRLADGVRAATRRPPQQRNGKQPTDGLDEQTAPDLFAAWLAKYRPNAQQPADFDEFLVSIAESWTSGAGVAYAACSPHRVAAKVVSIRDYYQDDDAEHMVAMLPDWIAFLSEHNGTPSHLIERGLPYATGMSYPGVDGDNFQSRVTE